MCVLERQLSFRRRQHMGFSQRRGVLKATIQEAARFAWLPAFIGLVSACLSVFKLVPLSPVCPLDSIDSKLRYHSGRRPPAFASSSTEAVGQSVSAAFHHAEQLQGGQGQGLLLSNIDKSYIVMPIARAILSHFYSLSFALGLLINSTLLLFLYGATACGAS
jgi:hypothetical protein